MMTNLAKLYDDDLDAWAVQNADLLRHGRVAEADIAHIAEELETMGKRDRHELVSRLIILLAHLLKWEHQFQQLSGQWQEFTGKSWRASIDEQRLRIARQLQLSPSLKSYLADAVSEAYPDAVKLATRETGLVRSEFPDGCPYTVEQLLDEEFFP